MNYSKICLLLITICLIILTFTLGLSKSGIEWLRDGYDLYKKAKYEEAIESYKEALKEQPESFEINLSIGKCYSKLGDYEEAIKYYNKAIDFNVENLFTVYYNKGKAYLEMKEYREAIDCFDEALKIKPGNVEAKNRKEEAEKILGKKQYNDNIISSARENRKKAIEYYNKGLEYFNNRNYEVSITWFNEALKLDPLFEEAKNKKKEAERFLYSIENYPSDTWDLKSNFDSSNNKNGPWFFGYKEEISGFFKVFPFKSINADDVFVWANARDTRPPSIWRNTLSRSAYRILSGKVSFHPGPHGEYTTIRWQAPFSGEINICGCFGEGDRGYVDVYILKNNKILFSELNTGVDKPFNLNINVNKGDYIDFEAGMSSDGHSYDNTLLDVKITKILLSSVGDNNTWSLPADFESVNNSDTQWFFGYKEDLESPFKCFLSRHVSNITNGVPAWYDNMGTENPGVWKNTISSKRFGVTPSHIGIHPGPDGELAVVRWVSPFTGEINICVFFGSGDSGHGGASGHVDTYIVKNNEVLFHKLNTSDDESFDLTININKGDNIDFQAGMGSDGNGYDNTPLDITIRKK